MWNDLKRVELGNVCCLDGVHLVSGAAGAEKKPDKQQGHSRRHAGFNDHWNAMPKAEQQAFGANKWDVRTVVEERPLFRLRRDLTPEQRIYVLSESRRR